jgi:tetratricopeptide (TPR) repeat protein
MKKITVFAVCFMIFSSLSGQDIIEKICLSICNCVDTIENMDSLQKKIDRCVPESMVIYFSSINDNETGYLSNVDTIKKTVDKVMKSLTYYCPKIKEFILTDKEEKFYKMSDSEMANQLYNDASSALQSNDYKTAEKKFIKATKESPLWVLPLDDLGLTYRLMGNYKKAIKYYSKSLELYPEGPYAIQNQAVAFTFLKDFESALKNYSLLINLYPKNPEGYFGKGKTYFLMEDYENALDYLFHCHKIYSTQNSDYVKDTESLIAAIHNKMKERNQLDIFLKKAENHGITINN